MTIHLVQFGKQILICSETRKSSRFRINRCPNDKQSWTRSAWQMPRVGGKRLVREVEEAHASQTRQFVRLMFVGSIQDVAATRSMYTPRHTCVMPPVFHTSFFSLCSKRFPHCNNLMNIYVHLQTPHIPTNIYI